MGTGGEIALGWETALLVTRGQEEANMEMQEGLKDLCI